MNKNPKVLVGIEFGTSEIGYEYAFFSNKENVYISSFSDQYKRNKIPAEIILDTNLKDILAFGMECREFISIHHKQKNEYEYFKQIKINLNQQMIEKQIYNLLLQKYYRKYQKKPLNKFIEGIILLLKEKISNGSSQYLGYGKKKPKK